MSDTATSDDIAARLRANWLAVRPFATGATISPGLVVKRPTPDVWNALPAFVYQALAAAAPAGGPPLRLVKLSEITDGALISLIDDGSVLTDPTTVHVVASLVVSSAGAATSHTYQLAAVPALPPRP
jgi:hypothetical protein